LGAVVLQATGLTKRYSLTTSASPGARDSSADSTKEAATDFAALHDVSFTLEAGDTLGLIGRNGAGKSTLLGVLAGTIQPTQGSVAAQRRVASLLDLGTGFQPLETGRQNAESMLALYLRISRKAAARRLAAVQEFSGLHDRFEDPIRTYSDGMRLRLAFATVSVLQPEILITDEVLVVGDAEFQNRCERWFDAFLAGGGTLVLCSHDLSQIGRLCRRALWLDNGEAAALGETADVVRAYRESLGATENDDSAAAGVEHDSGAASGLPFEVIRLSLRDTAGTECQELPPGSAARISIDVAAPAGIPHVFLGITTAELVPVYGVASDMDGVQPEKIAAGLYRFELSFPDLPLLPGGYRLRAHALDETGTRLYDTVQLEFRVQGELPPGPRGLVGLPHRFLPQEPA
jgi:lipopolysaccharide transport system ATP-binding protein